MLIDFIGCWLVEIICKHFFADLKPKPLITRGRERREKRRAEEEKKKLEEQIAKELAVQEKKAR